MLYLWIALAMWLLPAAIVGCAILKIVIQDKIEARRGRHRKRRGRHWRR